MTASLEFNPLQRAALFRHLLGGGRLADVGWLVLPVVGCLFAAGAESMLVAHAALYSLRADTIREFGFDTRNGPSSPYFPLLRDAPTLVLALLIGASMVCIRSQTAAFANAIPAMEQSGVIRWRSSRAAATRRTQRLFGWCFLRGLPAAPTTRDQFGKVCDRCEANVRRSEPVLLISAVALASGLVLFENYHKDFALRAPDGLNAHLAFTWAQTAYSNWWAATTHPAGAAVYGVVAAFGIFIVMLQNSVGLQAVVTLAALPRYAQLHVDWLNEDGSYGWAGIAAIYRTVYISLTIRAVAIAGIIAALGWVTIVPIVIIAVAWTVFVALYVAVPYLIFRSGLERRRTVEINKIGTTYRSLSVVGYNERRIATDAIAEIRDASLNPLGLPRLEASGFVIVVLLPIVLTVLQIVAQ